MNNLIKAADELAKHVAGQLMYMDLCNDKGDVWRNMHAALTAYRAARESAGGVEVKPLVWESEGFGYWTSVGVSGKYKITIGEDAKFFTSGPGVRSSGTDLDGEKKKCDAANAEELATFLVEPHRSALAGG